MSVDARLKELGVELDVPPAPVANYVRYVQVGNLLFLSGHGPNRSSGPIYAGKVGTDVSIDGLSDRPAPEEVALWGLLASDSVLILRDTEFSSFAETAATGMSLGLYFDRAFSLIDMTDYVPATVKTMVFGFIIATISSYLGFTTESGTEGVGRASTRAVVFSSILIIVTNVLLVRLIFFIYPQAAG